MSYSNLALVIPALNPTQKLLELLNDLNEWSGPIVVINDGSTKLAQPVFSETASLGAIVLQHDVNRGKGAALKTAFSYCLNNYPSLIGCVTADADGQHTANDIFQVAGQLISTPTKLILGCRDFSKKGVPLRSFIGNRSMSLLFRMSGLSISDTQTGLRGIPSSLWETLISVPGERYEYETNMLFAAHRKGISFIEVPIRTIYIENNETSHFHPFTDTLRIISPLLRFALSSLISSLVDLFAFIALMHLPSFNHSYQIWFATFIARFLSSCFNYICNSQLVFRTSQKLGSLKRYTMLCILQAIVSAAMVSSLASFIHTPTLILKVIVDTILFFVSFFLQRFWVFSARNDVAKNGRSKK